MRRRRTEQDQYTPGEGSVNIEAEEDDLMRKIISQDVSYLAGTQPQTSLSRLDHALGKSDKRPDLPHPFVAVPRDKVPLQIAPVWIDISWLPVRGAQGSTLGDGLVRPGHHRPAPSTVASIVPQRWGAKAAR